MPENRVGKRCAMQLDYHYHVIYHLAELAGLKASEAGTIAYASQYVDDSTESEPVEPFPDQQFDTVRTAHYNLGAFDWNIQKKIYMPFHFLPARIRWNNPKAFSYVTRPASPKMNDLSAKLVETALAEPNFRFRLVRMGVALHTVADTFAHFGFSGRRHRENTVGKIWVQNDQGAWDYKYFQTIGDIFLPKIGHVEAYSYPDLPYETWRYTNVHRRKKTRKNLEHSLDGVRLIYRFLRMINDGNGKTADLETDYPTEYRKIALLLEKSGSIGERSGRWAKHTGAPSYSRLTWRNEALQGNVQWDDMSERRRKYQMEAIKGKSGFDASNWAYFHRAAHLQRSQVLAWLN